MNVPQFLTYLIIFIHSFVEIRQGQSMLKSYIGNVIVDIKVYIVGIGHLIGM